PSQTGSGPISRWRIFSAASRMDASGEITSTLGVIMSLSCMAVLLSTCLRCALLQKQDVLLYPLSASFIPSGLCRARHGEHGAHEAYEHKARPRHPTFSS